MEKNNSIKCTVGECKYNYQDENYCTLNCVSIGTHEPHPSMPECVDCKSFVCKDGCCH